MHTQTHIILFVFVYMVTAYCVLPPAKMEWKRKENMPFPLFNYYFILCFYSFVFFCVLSIRSFAEGKYCVTFSVFRQLHRFSPCATCAPQFLLEWKLCVPWTWTEEGEKKKLLNLTRESTYKYRSMVDDGQLIWSEGVRVCWAAEHKEPNNNRKNVNKTIQSTQQYETHSDFSFGLSLSCVSGKLHVAQPRNRVGKWYHSSMAMTLCLDALSHSWAFCILIFCVKLRQLWSPTHQTSDFITFGNRSSSAEPLESHRRW